MNLSHRYKHRWECLIEHSLVLSSESDCEDLLRHIKDLSYVLSACHSVILTDRNQTINLIRFGLSLCNSYLKSHGYYSCPSDHDNDTLSLCHCDHYSYSVLDLQKDSLLLEVVLRKFQFTVELLKMRLYKAILTTSSRGLNSYDWREFENRFVQRRIIDTIHEYAEEGDTQALRQILCYCPQCFLPYRYEILSVLPMVTEPSDYFDLLPSCRSPYREGWYEWQQGTETHSLNLLDSSAVNWLEKREIVKALLEYVSISQEFSYPSHQKELQIQHSRSGVSVIRASLLHHVLSLLSSLISSTTNINGRIGLMHQTALS